MRRATAHITKLVDTVTLFPVWDGTSHAKAHVRIYRRQSVRGTLLVIMVSQISTGNYTSITNAFEEIATALIKEYHVPSVSQRVCWVEHYPPGSVGNQDHRFCEVSLRWKSDGEDAVDPRWRFMVPEEVQVLIGEMF